MTPEQGVGLGLRMLREVLGLSQAEFAVAAGVTQAQWSRWEAGKSVPDVIEWDRIRAVRIARCPRCEKRVTP